MYAFFSLFRTENGTFFIKIKTIFVERSLKSKTFFHFSFKKVGNFLFLRLTFPLETAIIKQGESTASFCRKNRKTPKKKHGGDKQWKDEVEAQTQFRQVVFLRLSPKKTCKNVSVYAPIHFY